MKKVLLFSALLLACRLSGDQLQERITRIERNLGVRIIYTRHVRDTWGGSRYTIPGNTGRLNRYLTLLGREFGKYPAGFLRRARAGNIILTEKYSFRGNHQAAMPDPYGNRLYLSVDGAYGNSSETYLVHVMHHELNHCTEYAIWGSQYYRWPDWSALIPGFRYGRGGITAYRNRRVDYYSLKHPRRGFINLYSMTGQEEDRSEIVAVMMSDIERPLLLRFCRNDNLLRRKVVLMCRLLDRFSEITGNRSYWTARTAGLRIH